MAWVDRPPIEKSCLTLAARLGMQRRGSRWGPCPACREGRSRSDERPPLLLAENRWKCLLCGSGGSWGSLVAWAICGADYSEATAAGVLDWARSNAGAEIAALAAPQPPEAPPVSAEELRRLLAAVFRPSASGVAYLRSRGIWSDDHPPPFASMSRPVGLPEVETSSGRMCPIWPWAADVVVGLRDQAGQLRSIHARRTDGRTPKALFPIGRSRRGLSMRSPAAVARPGDPVLVVEGLTDYLLACTLTPVPVVGIGSGSPIEPRAAWVVTHPDPPGLRYAAPYEGKSVGSADLCDLGRVRARELLASLGVPVRGS